MKGISPGPFTEEFLTREQGTLRLLGSLCMAGDTSSCVFLLIEWSALCRPNASATDLNFMHCMLKITRNTTRAGYILYGVCNFSIVTFCWFSANSKRQLNVECNLLAACLA